jgi:hypothetical protein
MRPFGPAPSRRDAEGAIKTIGARVQLLRTELDGELARIRSGAYVDQLAIGRRVQDVGKELIGYAALMREICEGAGQMRASVEAILRESSGGHPLSKVK